LRHREVTAIGWRVVPHHPFDVATGGDTVDERGERTAVRRVKTALRHLRDGIGERQLDELHLEVLLLELATLDGEEHRCEVLALRRRRELDRGALGQWLRRRSARFAPSDRARVR